MSKIICGDALESLKNIKDCTVQTCITSPPYYSLRDYKIDGQIGLEDTPEAYVNKLIAVFDEVKRVLREDGTMWLVLGDSYATNAVAGNKVFGNPEFNINRPSREATSTPGKKVPKGLKAKDLLMIPATVAIALRNAGWYLRSDIIWAKGNPMPSSVIDRPTDSHEHIFLLAKSSRYYYDIDAIREPHTTNVDPSALVDWRAARRGEGASDKVGDASEYLFRTDRTLRQPGKGKVYLGNPAGRNRRDVWRINTKPYADAHFAVFPPEIPELCVLAGSSNKACPICRSPWVRQTEVIEKGTANDTSEYAANLGGHSATTRARGNITPDSKITTGFEPSCGCFNNDGSSCSIVLDPFFGSGTVGLIATKLGREYIGIELNPEYCELAEKRLLKVQTTLFD